MSVSAASQSPIQIEEVLGKSGRRRFVRFQFDLYRKDPMWVPPLIRDEVKALDAESNPGLENCELRLWLAMRDGECLGRVAGVINRRDNQIRSVSAARFCLLDFVDEAEVAQRLLETVEAWAAERGMGLLEGPLGLATFECSAVLVEGFDRLPTAVSSYNYPYYGVRIEACGFAKEIDYVEHRFRVPSELDPKYEKVAAYVLKKKGLRLEEKKSRKALLPQGREIFQLVNEAYSELYEFTPMSDGEIDALIKKFFSFIDPRFVKMVVDRDDAIVAIGVAMPSMSGFLQALRGTIWRGLWPGVMRKLKPSSDTLDLYLVAVKPELRNAGLTAILMHEMHKQAVASGFEWVETNGELETNTRVLSMWKDIEQETGEGRGIYSSAMAGGGRAGGGGAT